MKQKNYQRWSRPLLLTLLSIFMAFSGATSVWAQVTEGFEYATDGTTPISVNDGNMGLSNGWVVVGSGNYVGITTGTSKDLQLKSSSYVYEGTYSIGTQYGNSNTWLVCPVEVSGNLKFYARRYNTSRTLTIGIASKSGDVYTITNSSFASYTTQLGTEFTEFTVNLGDDPVYVAFKPSYAFFDNVTYIPYQAASGPGFAVKDGSTKLSSPYAYNFGLATAGTTKTFKLTNPGTAATPISVDASGANGFTAAVEDNATSIPAGGEKTLTITMPNATASGSVVVTPTGDGLSAFTFNVSGTYRDANKVYETLGSGSIPEDWSQTSWSFATGYAYTNAWSQTSNARLITPKLDIKSGEKIMFEAIGTYPSTPSYQTMVVEYSSDKSTWTASEKAITLTSDWQTVEIDDIPVGSYYIAIHASQARVRNYYGGELPKVAKMTVTEPATLDFGLYDKGASPAPTKTFTIANTGTATLNGINVTSANAAFAITGAPTSLAAGEDAEVTITMSTATAGALSSLITVSATDMADASFTVTGAVKPAGMPVEEFSGTTIPSGWTSTGSWSFTTDGVAVGTSSSAYLYTPKLKFSDGDFLIIKMAPSDTYSGDYLSISGSTDNGETYTAYTKQIEVPQGKDVYANYVVADLPATINKIRFTGYYVSVDEIHGLTYAPVLSVTKDEAVVNSPAAYDFGECAANATVTYYFANTGGGTINITNVAITGDGAAAYSTNWTESVAAPFALTITRSYDAGRAGAGAQEAVVTVTTSEGDFVINVTGTDKAANAPELSVTLGEDPVMTGDAANFGTNLKAAPAVKTYTITNSGTGTLTGTIATSDDTQFTVSKTAFSLGAAESTTFDVALVFNTTYGAKAATITIHPTVGGLDDVVINASASTLDPEAWTEDFEGGSLPTGWVANNWSVDTFTYYENTTNMALAPSGSTAGTLITPCLTAKAGDVLTWDGYFNWYDEAMTVEYSADNQETWTKIYDAYKAQSEFGSTRYTHKEMSFTAPANGNYYLRFTSTYSNGVDNFSGFKLNLPEHIMSISSYNIPTSGQFSPTMKATQSFNATVTVQESRGVNENDVVAKLYMNGVVIGTSDPVSVDASSSKQITIVCTPAEADMDGGAEMYIAVEWAGTTLTTSTETRYVAELVRLDMTENSEPTISTGYSAIYDVVTLTRSFIQGWNTFVAPQDVTLSEIHENAKAYTFTGYDNVNHVLTFTQVDGNTLTKATPYIIYVPEAIASKTLTWESPVIYSSYVGAENIKVAHNEITFQGTYAPMAAGTLNGNYGISKDNRIAMGNGETTMKGFRAYLVGDLTSARISIFDETTGISRIYDANEVFGKDAKVYNLNGQRVENAHKGLYIVNGRKVVVK